MPTLERRVCALESASPSADELTIIWRIVSPGRLDDEIYGLRDDDGSLWTRLPEETEQELIDRATIAVQRSQRGVARLMTAERSNPAVAAVESVHRANKR